MFEILGGKNCFWQWDINQKLIITNAAINEVHFCNGSSDCSLVCAVYQQDGARLVDVPNILLQDYKDIRVFCVNDDNTRLEKKIKVIKRTKPADYMYTETEIKTYSVLEKQIEEVAANAANKADYNDFKNTTNTRLTNYYKLISMNADEIEKNVAATEQNAKAIEQNKEDIAALKEQGGGGSASDVDWAENNPNSPSYVKNRTHWMEEGQVSIWDNVAITEADAENLTTPFNYPLEIGKSYTVIYNGTEYICECGAADLLGSGTIFLPALGSWEFLLTEDVSLMREPFVIIALTDEYKEMAISQGVPAEYVQNVTGLAISLDGAEPPWTFSIIGDGTIYHKLNPRFLPDGGVGWTEEDAAEKEILNFSMTQEEWWENGAGAVYFPINGELVIGNTYRVNYNGTDYECLCKSVNYDLFGGSYPTLGNDDINDTTQEPFYIIYLNGKISGNEDIAAYVGFTQGFEHEFPATVSVYGKGEKIHKIDEKYLPGGNGTKITLTKEGDLYTTDFPFIDAMEMSASELQAAITIIDGNQEWSVFAVSRKQYGEAYMINLYVMPFSDTQAPVIRRIIWIGNPSTGVSIADMEAYSWILKEDV